jgi:hypothetical protein
VSGLERCEPPSNSHLRAVPSIANEYMRRRGEHDATARRWTQLYAMRPAPASKPTPEPAVSTLALFPMRAMKPT